MPPPARRPWPSSRLGPSLRRNSLLMFRAAGLDFVSGERVVRTALLAAVLQQIGELPRFGIEVYMNRRIIELGLAVAVTRWPNVAQARKTEKLGLWRGLDAEWRMVRDLIRVAHPAELLAQSWHLAVLRTPRERFFKVPRSRGTGA